MSDTIAILLSANAGLALGAIFFGGLWWSTGKAVTSQHVALWIVSSLLLRIAIVTTGFYLVGGNQWERFGACLIGFITGRVIVTALIKRLKLKYGFAQSNLTLARAIPSNAPKQATNDNTVLDT